MILRWWKHRMRYLEERREAAEAEARRSAELLARTRQETAPIKAAAEHNQFADIIRQALAQGWEEGKP